MPQARKVMAQRAVAAVGVLCAGLVTSAVSAPAAVAAGATRTPHHGDRVRMVHRERTTKDFSDTYVTSAAPSRRHGHMHRLDATDRPNRHKVAFVKFRVPSLPHGARVKDATITFTRTSRQLPASQVELRQVNPNGWNQRTLVARSTPSIGHEVAKRQVADGLDTVSFQVHHDVTGAGRYAFALTATARHAIVRFQSRESANPPRLTLHYVFPRLLQSHPVVGSPNPTNPSGPSGSNCTLSSELVPSCGVLFGGVLTSWGGSNIVSQYKNAEAGTGVHLALDHDYLRPGMTLSSDDVTLAKTPGAILQLNWKPAYSWASADGGNSTVNSQIDAMANSIKALGSTKIFLTIFHEPENDVTSDPNCPNVNYKGSAGTPAQYRAMWANVESRFAALGVTNVVWDMNYMNYSAWDCLVNDLWPGNSLVDWVMFESYSGNDSTFSSSTSHFYNLLTAQSDASHNYLSKPWGIGEFGTNATDASVRNSYYSSVKSALDSNEFPNLKFLSIYDSPGVGGNYQVAYTDSSQPDPSSLSNFMTLVKDPAIAKGDATVS